MDSFFVQLITLVSLLVGTTLSGALPLLITKVASPNDVAGQEQTRRRRSSTFLLFFGGGVFISDCFLVLLPQANHYLASPHEHGDDDDDHSSHHHGFPIPEFIIACSFFAVYILKEFIHYLLRRCSSPARKSSDARVQFCSCAKRHTECSRTFKAERPDPTLFGLGEKLESGNAAAEDTANRLSQVPNVQSELLRSSIITQIIPNYGTLANVSEPPTDSQLPVLSPPVLLAEERNQMEQTILQNQNELIVGNLLTVLALMLQFLFQGFSLVQQTASHTKWYSGLAVCLQNFLLTFSVCSDYAAHSKDLTYFAMNIGVLSIISPIGIIFAMIKPDYVQRISSDAKGLVAAIACGILIFTTFYEVLKNRNQGDVAGLLKFAAIVLGALVMSILQYAALSL